MQGYVKPSSDNTPSVTHRNTCRACSSADLHLVLPMIPTPPGDHYVTAENLNELQACFPLNLSLCRACGLAQLLDVVDPEILYGNYIYSTANSLGLVNHFSQYADSVIDIVKPSKDTLVVDVGSNDGTLLKAFARRGMRVLGIDPAREVAASATADGIETWTEFFGSDLATKIRRERGPAGIITANNVFANIDDLADLADGIRILLADDGVFVFETGYFPDLVRQRIIDNIYHEHVTYYSVKPLISFFANHGMELASVWHEPTKGGSIRGLVRLSQEKSKPLPASELEELVRMETDGGFDRVDSLVGFCGAVESVKSELVNLVRDLKSQGRTIAGYGASVGVTTLLHYLELGDAISFVVDDNPTRHGRFTPGYHLPVLPSSALYERKVDDVLLFAWRYSEPILKKHEAFRNGGGRFVIPLPEVRIV